MGTESTTGEYMVIFRCAGWSNGRSNEELQTIVDKFAVWYDWMQSREEIQSGLPLHAEGKFVSGKNGKTVADGPFAESKEAIGGFLIVKAAGMDEAVALASEWPLLEYGYTIEVRPMAMQCATMQRLNDPKLAHANA